MDMVGRGTADVATVVYFDTTVVETSFDGFVDNEIVLSEDLFEVNRVREVWVLGTLRAAFVAEHYTNEEAVAEAVMKFPARRYGMFQASHVGFHKDVPLFSYPIGPRVGAQRKFEWEN